MSQRFSSKAIQELSDSGLWGEKNFLGIMARMYSHELDNALRSATINREMGYERVATLALKRARDANNVIKGIERIMPRIDDEIQRRGLTP